MRRLLLATQIICILCLPGILRAESGWQGDSAADLKTDTINFDKNLSVLDDTVQKALETLDELTAGGGSMTYPGAGIPLSTGSAWGTSITNNSANWNTAYGWGNHASGGYELASNKVTTVSSGSTDAQYPSAKLLYDQLALKLATGGTAADSSKLNGQSASYYQTAHANLTSLAGLSFVSTSFVKMTSAGTFGLDINTYLTSASALDGTKVANADLGEVGVSSGVWTVENAAVIGKVITGFSSGAGALAGTDTILAAINKLDGNVGAKLASNFLSIGSLTDPNAHNLMAWDDTDGAIKFITIGTGLTYTQATHTLSSTGGAVTYSKGFMITNPTSAADSPLWRAPAAITITGVHVLCVGGTNIVGQLWEYDGNGANGAVVDSADITGTAGSNVNDDGTLSNASIDSGDYVGWVTTSVSGTPTKAIITFDYQLT